MRAIAALYPPKGGRRIRSTRSRAGAPSILAGAYRGALVSVGSFSASLARDEAVLRFPYDERLRQLLRAIPGRRWDPLERAWCLPLGPDQAEALARLLDWLPGKPQVSDELARALRRRRAARRRDQCLVDLARPDENWWLSFATDAAPELVAALLGHPDARAEPAIGRAVVPLDDRAARVLDSLRAGGGRLRLSDAARLAVADHGERRRRAAHAGEDRLSDRAGSQYDVEFRRDRRGGHWIMIAAELAPLAAALADRAGLRALGGPGATLGLAAVEHDAELLLALLAELEPESLDPRVAAWLQRATTWRGNIEVDGAGGEPVFLLLGDIARLPSALRERAASAPGGAKLPLTLESWRLIDGRLEGWLSAAAKRCVAALLDGRPAPPAVLELSGAHEEPTFVLAPGHDRIALERFAELLGALPPLSRRDGAQEHARLPAIRADPFCVPELDALLAAREIWVEPAALAALQEIRRSAQSY